MVQKLPAGQNILTPIKIDIYDATGVKIIDKTNLSSGFDAQGNACNNFNATQGDDKCFFRYEVAVKRVTQSGGRSIVVVHADLRFKAKSSKYVFNSAKDKFSFDYTVGVDLLSAAQGICTSIGGHFTNNTCTQMLTPSVSCDESNQFYQGTQTGSITTSRCGVVQLTEQLCPAGQYLSGYDQNNHIVCKEFVSESDE